MWPGVPFLYYNEKMANAISISKIPSISIQSSFSWETIIAAFISGLVPALISFYVIKKNNESVRYQQKQEYNRHYLAHLRMVISEYVSQVDKVKRIHFNSIKNKFEYTGINVPEMMFNAMNELEGAKASLLISIPDDEYGAQFKSKVNYLSLKLIEIRGKDSIRYRRDEIDNDARDMNWAYDAFIVQANSYLSRYLFDDLKVKSTGDISNFFKV